MSRRLTRPATAAAVAGLLIAATAGLLWARANDPDDPPPVGLSLFFRNGQMAPLTLVGAAPRYLDEVDLVVTAATTATEDTRRRAMLFMAAPWVTWASGRLLRPAVVAGM